NINHLSDFGSTECNIEIVDANYQSACLNLVKSLMKKSAKNIEATDYLKKLSFNQKLINYCAYHAMRLSFRILFYFQSDLKSPFKRH
ncbi:MAG: hypothetical protein ACOVK9_01915, partial [Bacteroidia bacterium]